MLGTVFGNIRIYPQTFGAVKCCGKGGACVIMPA